MKASTLNHFSLPALVMGVLAAFVGYSASFTIVLAGITSMGATPRQAATGLFVATLGMGLCGIWLAWNTRTPAAVAWSTPGAAFLASAATLPGGFSEAVGAFIVCAVLILATGYLQVLSTLVAKVPKQVASALLAGVLLKLCLAPALALGSMPLLFFPVFIAWLAGLMWHRLAAMPMAVVAFALVLYFALRTDFTDAAVTTSTDAALVPALLPVMPVFSIAGAVSLAVPLFLVTMAGQNIPGFAVLELNKYKIDQPKLLKSTGLFSLLMAPFGSVPINMSAITAAMMVGDDAGPDASKRYQSALTAGLLYVALAFAAGIVTSYAAKAPAALITGIAGLALLPALVASINAAFAGENQIEAPALTFLIAASGMTLFGISGAFWGVVVGVIVWWLKALKNSRALTLKKID